MSEQKTRKKYRWPDIARIAVWIMQVLLMLILLYVSFVYRKELFPIYIRNISVDLIGMFIMLCLYFCIMRIHPVTVSERTPLLFQGMVAIVSLFLFSDAIALIVDRRVDLRWLNYTSNTILYLCNIALATCFWYFTNAILDEDLKDHYYATWAVTLTAAFGALLVFGNLLRGYYFVISPETAAYLRQPGYSYSIICPAACLVMSVILILQIEMPLSNRLVLLVYPVLPFVNAVIVMLSESSTQPDTGATLYPIGLLCTIIMIYSHLYVIKMQELIDKEKQLGETSLSVMRMQINPHFIFNTLASVDSLIRTNPEQAQLLLRRFTVFLRSNYVDMTKKPVVPFSEERQILEQYLAIEEVRYPQMEVVYDIQAENFSLPVLTIQPLAENAVRHGISKRRDGGGKLTISTREEEKAWVIKVRDNGVGFPSSPDMSGGFFTGEQKPEKMPVGGGKHVGIENVRGRLEMLCGGTLKIESIPEVGTICTVTIPKGKRHRKEETK